MIKKISLFFIICFLTVTVNSTPSTVVNVNRSTPSLLILQYFNLNGGGFLQEFSISFPSDQKINSIVSADSYTVYYISQDPNAFYLNVYDIQYNSSKVLSTIKYVTNNPVYSISYDYQTINTNGQSSSSSSQSYVYNLIGTGNMSHLTRLSLNFEQNFYNESYIGSKQRDALSYYASGYDYYTNNFYFAYSSSGCSYFETLNATSGQYTSQLPSRCVLNLDIDDHFMPVMYNGSTYLLVAYFDSNEMVLNSWVFNRTLVTNQNNIFNFVNVPNDTKNWIAPYYFIATFDQYITVVTATSIGKVQYTVINLIDYSTRSFMLNPTLSISSILTF